MEKEMNYELTPRGDRVLIKIKEAKEVTKGGIILPKSVQEKTQEGIVLEVGSLVEELNIGDTIIFDHYSGIKIPLNGMELLIIKEDDIVAHIKSVVGKSKYIE